MTSHHGSANDQDGGWGSAPGEAPPAAGHALAGTGASERVRFPEVQLKRGEGRRAERGHLWVFSNEIERITPPAPAVGSEVIVRSGRGHFLGTGLYHPHALIAVRIHSRAPEACSAPFIRRRLEEALARRRRDLAGGLPEAYRLCFSEGDLLPGVVADVYGAYVVVQILTAGMEQRRELVFSALESVLSPRGIFERSDAPAREYEGLPSRSGWVRGTAPPADTPLSVRLGGLEWEVDVAGGQKTGMFLDQVAAWQWVGARARGRRVLDMCCYQGGFAISAAAGGAASVRAVDVSAAALELARRSASRNGVADRIEFHAADAFDELRALGAAPPADPAHPHAGRFDLIVLDPPAFAKNRKQLVGALRGYRDLNMRALRLLGPGGVLVTFSCSHHVTPDVFDETLVLAARDAGRTVRVLDGPVQPPDHPQLLATPETLYIKSRALEVL